MPMFIDAIVQKRSNRTAGDSNLKSLLKTLSWRLVGTMDTIVIAWILTGEVSVAFSIGSVEVFTKMVLYYFHERLWNKIS